MILFACIFFNYITRKIRLYIKEISKNACASYTCGHIIFPTLYIYERRTKMKKFTTVLAAASLMLAGLASCNEPGPQPEPPVPEATWDEKVGEWLEGTDFTGELPLPVEALEGLEVSVAEAQGKISVTIANLEETVPEPEEGEEEQQAVTVQPRDYYTVFGEVLSNVYQNYVYDDEDGTMDEGSIDLLTKFDADGDYANLHMQFYAPYLYWGMIPMPGAIQLTWDVEKALTPAETLTAINKFIAGNGVANSNFLKEGSDLTGVGDFFRLKEYSYNACEEAISEVADLFNNDPEKYAKDGAGDFYTTVLWNYASKTTELEAVTDAANELIDELEFVKTMAEPAVSIDQKGEQFTYITMSEGKYNRVKLVLSSSVVDYYGSDVIGITIYAMPNVEAAKLNVTEAVVVKTFSKPEGPGVVPAEDALLNVLDIDAEGKWTYTAKYKGVGNIIETKAANAQGDSINGNFYEMYDQLRVILQVENASQTNTSAVTSINAQLATWFGEDLGFTVGLPDLTTKEPTGLNTKMRTIVDHEGDKMFVLQYNDYYPKSGFDPEDTKTYAQRWVELLAEQTYDPDGEGEQEAVAAWTTPELREQTASGKIWACYGVERVTVGTGMEAKEKRVALMWLEASAQFVLQISVQDAPSAWDVDAVNEYTSGAGFETVVPSLEGEKFFNLDSYLPNMYVIYAPDAEGELLAEFVEKFNCTEPNEAGALVRDPEPGSEEPEQDPEWIDQSFVSEGVTVYQFASIEVLAPLAGFDAKYGGVQIVVQAYTQSGITYFIIAVEQTTTNVHIIGNYLQESLGQLGWIDEENDMDINYDALYYVNVSCENYGGQFAVLQNHPYDPVADENPYFGFVLAYQAPDAYDWNDVCGDILDYYVAYDMFTYAGTGPYYDGENVMDYYFAFTDNDGECATANGDFKYGYFRFIADYTTLQVQLIWNVVAPNQNQSFDVNTINEQLELVGSEVTLGNPSALGNKFAHTLIDISEPDFEYHITIVSSVRTVSSTDSVDAFIGAFEALFNVEGATITKTNWNEETHTGTIVIALAAGGDPYFVYLEITVTKNEPNTEAGETDPTWTIVVSGSFSRNGAAA